MILIFQVYEIHIDLKMTIADRLSEFDLAHTTIELEFGEETCRDAKVQELQHRRAIDLNSVAQNFVQEIRIVTRVHRYVVPMARPTLC